MAQPHPETTYKAAEGVTFDTRAKKPVKTAKEAKAARGHPVANAGHGNSNDGYRRFLEVHRSSRGPTKPGPNGTDIYVDGPFKGRTVHQGDFEAHGTYQKMDNKARQPYLTENDAHKKAQAEGVAAAHNAEAARTREHERLAREQMLKEKLAKEKREEEKAKKDAKDAFVPKSTETPEKEKANAAQAAHDLGQSVGRGAGSMLGGGGFLPKDRANAAKAIDDPNEDPEVAERTAELTPGPGGEEWDNAAKEVEAENAANTAAASPITKPGVTPVEPGVTPVEPEVTPVVKGVTPVVDPTATVVKPPAPAPKPESPVVNTGAGKPPVDPFGRNTDNLTPKTRLLDKQKKDGYGGPGKVARTGQRRRPFLKG